MDIAICYFGERKEYPAKEFEKLPNVSDLRHYLVCPGCGNPAYFVKRKTSGQGPHFGARPHKSDCILGVDSLSSQFGKLENEDFEIVQNGDIIEIDFGYGSTLNSNVSENEDSSSSLLKGKHFSKNGEHKKKYFLSQEIEFSIKKLNIF